MKCDYCGSLFEKVPEKGVCPNCGAAGLHENGSLAEFCIGRKIPEASPSAPDLEFYYKKYKDDRNGAVAALRIDTGLDPVRAQQIIDRLFQKHAEA